MGTASSAANLTLNTTAGNIVFNGSISDDNGNAGSLGARLTIQGTNKVILNAPSTYIGGTSVTGGTLAFSNYQALGTGSVSLAAGTTLQLAGNISSANPFANTLTLTGNCTLDSSNYTGYFNTPITNAYALTIQGNGMLVIGGANTPASTTINSGTLALNTGATLANSIIVNSGGTYDISRGAANPGLTGITANAGGNIRLGNKSLSFASGTIVGNLLDGGLSGLTGATLTKTSTGTLTLSGANTYTGSTTVSAGTLAIGNYQALGGGGLTLGANTVLQLAGNIPDTTPLPNTISLTGAAAINTNGYTGYFSSPITGAYALAIQGNGMLVIGGANTPASTTINSGTLALNTAASLSGSLTINAGAAYDLSKGASNPTISNITANTGSNIYLGDLTLALSSGTVYGNLLDGGLSGLSGSSLIKTGAGTLVLAGSNTYTGGTNLQEGTVNVGSSAALGDSSAAVNLGTATTAGTLQFGGAYTLSNPLSLAAAQTSTLDLNNYNGGLSGLITGGGSIFALTNSAGVAKTLTLSGANTYTGTTSIGSYVTLALLDSGTIGSSVLSFPDATSTLDISGITPTAITIGDLNSAQGQVHLGSKDLTFGTAASTTFGGIIQDGGISGGISGSLTKSGSGTATLSGSNTYTGGTTLRDGTLSISSADNIGSSSSPVIFNGISNPTLQVTGALTLAHALTLTTAGTIDTQADITTSGTIIGSGILTKTGPSILTVTGANTSGGATVTGGTVNFLTATNLGTAVTLDGGILELGASAVSAVTLPTLAITAGGGTIANASTQNLTVTPTDGSGVVTKAGTGLVTFSGINTTTGGTTVSAGTLAIGNYQALGTGTVNLATGTTLQLAGNIPDTTPLPNAISLTGSAAINTNGYTGYFSSPLTGANALTIQGNGMLVIGGANTPASTTIESGTLALNTGASLSGSLTINAGAAYDLSKGAANPTISSITANTGSNIYLGDLPVTLSSGTVYGNLLDGGLSGLSGSSLIKTGIGTVTLAGTNTYTGGTNIQEGTLNVVSPAALRNSSAAVNLGTATTAGTLQFGGASTLSNPLSLATAQTSTLDLNNYNGGLSGLITGGGSIFSLTNSAGVAKTLTLSGINSYTGTTSIGSYVTLALLNSGTIGNSALSFTDATSALDISGTVSGYSLINLVAPTGNIILGSKPLTLNNTADTIVASLITGTGSVNKTGSGALTLAGTNTYSGGTNVSAGTLMITNDSNLGAAYNVTTAPNAILTLGSLETSGTLKFAGNATLDRLMNLADGQGGVFDPNGNTAEISGIVSGNGSFTLNDTAGTPGILILTADNTYAGGTTITAGTLQLGNDSTAAPGHNGAGGGAITISPGGILDLNFGNATFATSMTNNGTVTIKGTAITSTSPLANNGTVINNGTSFTNTSTITNTATLTNNEVLINSGRLIMSSGSTLKGTGTLALAGGTLQFSGTSTVSQLLQLNNNSTIEVDNSVEQDLSTVISSLGATTTGFTKTGAGTLTLSANNTYVGQTVISAGTLALGVGGSIASSAGVQLSPGSTLDLSTGNQTIQDLSGVGGTLNFGASTLTVTANNTTSYAGSLAGSGNFIKIGSGKLILANTSSIGGDLNLTAGSLEINALGSIAAGGDFTAADNTVLSLGVGATTPLTINQATLGANNTLNISGIANPAELGRVLMSTATGIIGDFTTITVGGFIGDVDYLSLQTNKNGNVYEADYGLTWYANNNLANGVFTLTNGTDSFTASANLQDVSVNGGPWDGQTLTKEGAGTLILTGTNTYSGGTHVNGGTLQGNTISLPGPIINNAVVVFDQIASGTYNNIISGLGSLTKEGSGTLILSDANTYSGGTTVNAGTLQGNTTTLPGPIINNAAVVFDQIANGTYPESITGTGAVTKTGAGILTLTGNNVYSGGTTVTAGTLQGSTASLQGAITNNAAVIFNQTANGIYADILSGTGSMTKNNNGTLALSGLNTYTGQTVVNAGTLTVAASGSIAASTSVQLGAGSTLDVSAGDQAVQDLSGSGSVTLGSSILTATINTPLTYAGSLIGTGGFTKTGPETLTFSGMHPYEGQTIINGGTLTLESGASIASSAGVRLSPGSTLDLSAGNQNIQDLQGTGGTINLGGSVLTATTTTSTTYEGTLQGTGGRLIKDGSGTLSLTKSSTYTGGTAINGGTLSLADPLAAGNGALSNNAALELAFSTASFSTNISGTGTSTISGTDVALTGTNSGFAGAWTVSGSASVTETAHLGTASVALTGATSQLTLQPTAGVGYTFNNSLTGNGILHATMGNADDAFSFGTSVGTAFTGIVKLGQGTFDFSGNNTAVMANATLQLEADSTATVGGDPLAPTIQTVGNLAIDGGQLTFYGPSPVNPVSPDTINTAGLTLNSGIIQITIPSTQNPPTNWSGPGSTNPLLMQDELIVSQVINATSVSGNASNLSLVDQDGSLIGSNIQISITQGASTTAIGTYNYGLTHRSDGLYVTYGLTNLALQANETLVLSGDNAVLGASDFHAQLTGAGTVEINATDTIILNNTTNNYTGDTLVTNGTALLDSDNALGQTASLTIAPGAVTNLNGTVQTVGVLTTNGTLDMAEGTLTITNGGTTAAGTLTGDGSLTLLGGALAVTGANPTFAAATAIAPGASVSLTDAGGLGTGAIAVNGELTLNGVNGTFSNRLSGNGSVSCANSTLNLTGVNSHMGGTSVSTGAITVSTDENLGAATGGVNLDNATLQLGASFTFAATRPVTLVNTATIDTNDYSTTIAGGVSGSGNLVKEGLGMLQITGTNLLTGNISVNRDELKVNGSLANAAVTVQPGAKLSGNAIVYSLANTGVVAPGNSIGQVEVLTTYNNIGGTYTCEVNDAGESDLIRVNGTATLGGTLSVHPLAGAYQPFQPYTYTILTSPNNTITTTFDVVSGVSPLFSYKVVYQPKAVQLTMTRILTLSQEVTGGSGGAVSTVLDGMKDFTGTLKTAVETLSTLNSPQLVDALNHLTPVSNHLAQISLAHNFFDQGAALSHTIHAPLEHSAPNPLFKSLMASVTSPVKATLAQFSTSAAKKAKVEQLFNVLSTQAQPPQDFRSTVGQSSLWVGSNSLSLTRKSHSSTGTFIPELKTTSRRTQLGVDYQFSDNLLLGMTGGYSKTSYHLNNDFGDGRIYSYHVGAYGSFHLTRQWYMEAYGSYAYNRMAGKRIVSFPGFRAQATQKHQAHQGGGMVESGYEITLADQWMVTPMVGMGLVYLHELGYKETGAGTLNLTTKAQGRTYVQNKIGAQLAKYLRVGDTQLYGFIKLAYTHRKGLKNANKVSAAFINQPKYFTVSLSNKPDNLTSTGVGFSALFKNDIYITAGYNGDFGKRQRSHEAFCKIGKKF
jgi:autotransporter-associated beta strand protein